MTSKTTTTKDYVLFVHEKCSGSKESMTLLGASAVSNKFDIQNIATIPARMLPEYVTGVPTVVDLKAKNVYRGSRCVEFIREKSKQGFSSFANSGGTFASVDGGVASVSNFSAVDIGQMLSTGVEDTEQSMNLEQYCRMRDEMLPKHDGSRSRR